MYINFNQDYAKYEYSIFSLGEKKKKEKKVAERLSSALRQH